ncbi:tetratricopeptide repeat-containing sensor histidine kinase [Mucilaginibacter paludis]|uniref:histidine kinase n=1 Tax=Mucilaginibacter paludis DSM 18603 TaxID=714943 RepID=H1Y0N5_9SPHI|nr:ATP-binding protein [Mucilaginibacter paludis]EHQ28775.1 ATP-binding region ATPase domain protein [Mucilaginibacter paludis DSM 18603]
MKFSQLLLFAVFFLQQKAFCIAGVANYSPTAVVKNQLPTDSIDKINTLSRDIYLSDPAYARKLSAKALLCSKTINYKKGIGQSFLNIGITYWSQSYYIIGLLYIDTALKYFRHDRLQLSSCYCYIGRIYTDLKDYKSASHYLEKAREEAGTDPAKSKDVIVHLSYLYLKRKEFNKALFAVDRMMKICKSVKDTDTEAILYNRLANIYLAQNQYSKALKYCDKAIQMSYLVNNKRLRASSFVEKSGILLHNGHQRSAIRFATQALAMSDTLGIMDLKSKSFKAIIAAYDARHNYKRVLYFERQFNLFQEERYNSVIHNNSQIMRDYFELNAGLQGINMIKQQAKENDIHLHSQQNLIITLSASLILLSVALYIVYFYYRQKNNLATKLRDRQQATLAQSQLIESQARNLEELNGFKNKLLAIIGHDLRSPIQNLRNLTDMFDDGNISNEEISFLMKTINPVIKSAELTLSNLLIWADRQIRGIERIQAKSIDLMPVIRESEQIFRHLLDQKNISVQHHIGVDTLVWCDENHLKVILNNLISNAIKFTGEGGEIAITVERDKNQLIISVTDTGIGITDEEIMRILSANTHFSKPGTMGEQGTGIGLLLCRELIEVNGGRLNIKSNAGIGSTFYFNLPSTELSIN